MSANQYTIERIVFGATQVKSWATYDIDPGIVEALDQGSSQLDPTQSHITRLVPLVRGATFDVKTLCDKMWNTGGVYYPIPHIPIAAGSVCDIYFQRAAAGGVAGGAGTNIKATIAKGAFVPESVQQNGPYAAVTGTVYAVFDGTNAPVVFATAQSLLSGSGAATQFYVLRALKNGSAGSVLHGLNGLSLNFGIGVQQSLPSNSIYAQAVTLNDFRPTLSFETTDLATALGISGLAGATAAAGGLLLYLGEYDPAAAGVKAATALTLALPENSPFWPTGGSFDRTIGAVRYEAHGIGNDSGLAYANSPLAYATGATLPSESTSAGLFGMPIVKDNATWAEIESVSFDFGPNWLITPGANMGSYPWPLHATLPRREPMFDLNCRDAEYYTGLGISGRAVSSAFKLFLRAMAAQGVPVDNATASHVLLSAAAGRIIPQRMTGAHNALSTQAVRVRPTGGLSLSTGVAIS